MGMARSSMARSSLASAMARSSLLSGGVAGDPLLRDVLALYANGEQGALYYFTEDFAGLYQDDRGTTPVTAVGQPVGLMLDRRFGLARGAEKIPTANIAGWTPTSVNVAVDATSFTVTAGSLGVTLDILTPGAWYEVSVSGSTTAAHFSVNTADKLVGPSTRTEMLNGFGRCIFMANEGILYLRSSAGTATISDLSVRELPGNHASQATTTARPILSALKNIFIATHDYANAFWTRVNTAYAGGTLLETSTGEATTHIIRRNYQLPPGTMPYTLSVEVKGYGRSKVMLGVVGGSGTFWTPSTNPLVKFDLTTGAVISANPAGTTARIEQAADGYWRISVTMQPSGVGGLTAFGLQLLDDAGAEVFIGDQLKGVFLRNMQLEVGAEPTAYQRVTTATDYDWQGFPLYLAFDGVDDSLEAGTTTSFLYLHNGTGGYLSHASSYDLADSGQRYIGTAGVGFNTAGVKVGLRSGSLGRSEAYIGNGEANMGAGSSGPMSVVPHVPYIHALHFGGGFRLAWLNDAQWAEEPVGAFVPLPGASTYGLRFPITTTGGGFNLYGAVVAEGAASPHGTAAAFLASRAGITLPA